MRSSLTDRGVTQPRASTLRRIATDGLAVLCGVGVSIYICGAEFGLLPAAWWIVAVVVIRFDLDHYIVPDMAVVAIASLGLLQAAFTPAHEATSVVYAIVTGAGTFGLFWVIGAVYRQRTGRIGLGFGDVKLAGASAVWLSPGNMALTVEIAAIAGASSLLFRKGPGTMRETAIPFGAFLAPSAWLVFVAQPLIAAFFEKFT